MANFQLKLESVSTYFARFYQGMDIHDQEHPYPCGLSITFHDILYICLCDQMYILNYWLPAVVGISNFQMWCDLVF